LPDKRVFGSDDGEETSKGRNLKETHALAAGNLFSRDSRVVSPPFGRRFTMTVKLSEFKHDFVVS
jgi:hypothetical protein